VGAGEKTVLYLVGLDLLLLDPLDYEGDIWLLLCPGLPDLQDERGGTQHLAKQRYLPPLKVVL
jgi:hypothetical protein